MYGKLDRFFEENFDFRKLFVFVNVFFVFDKLGFFFFFYCNVYFIILYGCGCCFFENCRSLRGL